MKKIASTSTAKGSSCRFCGGELHQFLDLGVSPLCESYLSEEQLSAPETFYPLAASVCHACFLVQLPEHVSPVDIFTEYAYFSSYSDDWLAHARRYVDDMANRLGLGPSSHVVELGSNDGYLLQYFVKKGLSVLGVDPAANVAKAAEARGVRTCVGFFGADIANRLAEENEKADLIIGNNVLAQVSDINDFVEGVRILLKQGGTATFEFPHIAQTLNGNQFDQFYHEHYSYFSAISIEKIMAAHGLQLFDVERLSTHGGSLRIYVRHADSADRVKPAVDELLAGERDLGLHQLAAYDAFGERVAQTKRKLLSFLIHARTAGASVVGYGAPGKGNTLLNYCGIRTDFLDYTVDRNPYKHGKYLPGTRIPIFPPEKIAETKPQYVLILPWNLKDEIAKQLAYVGNWGGQLVVPIPEVKFY
jgi:C-methyltransferase-like protein/putative zinc binding protein/methyltransferase family protein